MPMCRVPSCDNPLMARGLCMAHYHRLQRHGDVLVDVPLQKKLQPKPLCQVQGCRNHVKNSTQIYCPGHLKRLRTYGSLQAEIPLRESTPKGMPLHERLWSQIDTSGGPDACWPWQGSVTKGYGKIRVTEEDGTSRNVFVHRLVYEEVYGPLPDDVILDHLCHTIACTLGVNCPHRRCCNDSHLKPSTHQENIQRGNSGIRQRSKTHCKRGHPYDVGNTYIRPDGSRKCQTCHRLYSKRGVPLDNQDTPQQPPLL